MDIFLKPKVSKKAFWDVRFDTLDYEKNSVFVIQRVFDYGLFEEIIEIIRFYGEARIKKEIVLAGWLSKKTISFCCALFHLKPEDFKCYTKKQLNPEHWNY
jgi:hypothetical protein